LQDIVKNHPFFESAICKLSLNQDSLLSCEERSAVLPLVQTVEPDEVETPGTIVERAMKRKKSNEVNGVKYSDLNCIPPTSNVCERLVSASR
jgi:hypothetical protein